MTPGRAIPGDREAAAGSRDCQSGVLPRGDVEDKIRKLESDKRELKTFLERETRTSKSLAGDLQQAGALHVAALAKGARVHKQKERAWGVEKEELLAKLETQADKLSSAEERLRQARLESPLAEEVRRLQETVARRGTELRDRRSEWNAEKEGLETELADARADVERIRNDRGSAQKELERVRRSQERERRDQDRVRRELERAERDIERLRSALEHERADLEQERAERTELRERLREEWSEVLGLEEVQAELSEEIEVVRQRDEQIGQLQAELDGEIEVVRQRNEQIRHLEAELNDEIEIVRQRDEQIDQLEEELNDEIEVVRQRDEQVVQLEEELNNETEVVRLRDERIDQLEAAHETSLVEERGQEIAELKAALRGKERERDGLRVTLGKAKELCERVHSLEGRLKRGQCAQGEAWACVVQEAKGLFSKGPEAGDEDLRRKRRRH